MRKTLILAGLLGLCTLGSSVRGATVCPGNGGCVYDATCPKGAKVVKTMKDLLLMINKAKDGETICVQPGKYVGKIDFKGKAITIKSTGGPGVTFLDGGGTGPVVWFHTFEGANSVLSGFTVQNGRAANGGGILIANASPTIHYNILLGNKAVGASGGYGRGGGMHVTGASAKPVVTCARFVRNEAEFGGGGLATTYFADPYVRFSHFEANKAPYGGAIASHSNGRLDLATTLIVANEATGDGGGIHSGTTYGNVLVRRVCLKDNKAASQGGGMWVPAGLAEVVNSTFTGNQASVGGGLAAGFGSLVGVSGSLFTANTTGGGSATLVHAGGSNTGVINHYNGFFGNTGATHLGTYGDLGLVFLDPALTECGGCCPGAVSPAIDAGTPDYHFVDADGTRNDMGACGGPAVY